VHTVRIVTDSIACLPPELVARYGIKVVPIELIWDGKTYRDGIDITPETFYARFATSQTYPTTSQPPPATFEEAFASLSREASGIVALHFANELSTTLAASKLAAESRDWGVPVRVIDTRTAAAPQGFIVLAAARAAASGASIDEVVSTAEVYRERVGMQFILRTLSYLHRGGRIGEAAAYLGTRLSVVPVLHIRDGKVRITGAVRTWKRGLERIITEVHKAVRGRPVRITVTHAQAPDEAALLLERCQAEFNCLETMIVPFSPVMGAHTGPGVVGVAWCLEDADD